MESWTSATSPAWDSLPVLEADPGFWYVLVKWVTEVDPLAVLSFKNAAFSSRSVSSKVLFHGLWSSLGCWAFKASSLSGLRSCYWWWWVSGGMVARPFHPCKVTLCQSVSRQFSVGCGAFSWIGRCWQAVGLLQATQALFCAWGPKPALLLQGLAAFGPLGSP